VAYSLGALGYASIKQNAGVSSQTKLAADCNAASTRTAMSMFTASAVLSNDGTTIIATATKRAWVSFGLPGSLFMSKVAVNARNYGSWSFSLAPSGGPPPTYRGSQFAYKPGLTTIGIGSCSIYNVSSPGDFDEISYEQYDDKYNASLSGSWSAYIDIWGS
jgi:hypothetical protein